MNKSNACIAPQRKAQVTQDAANVDWFAGESLNATAQPIVPTDESSTSSVLAILAEFVGVFDEWEVVEWFCTPNIWLGNGIPTELLCRDPGAVVGVARADRFIAVG